MPPGKPGYVTGVGAPETEPRRPNPEWVTLGSDVPLSKKCSRFLSGFYQKPCRNTITLLAQKATRNSTLRTATTDNRSSPTTERPVEAVRGSPAAQRPLGASSPERASSAPRGPHGNRRPSDPLVGSQRKAGRRGRPSGSAPLPSGAVSGGGAAACEHVLSAIEERPRWSA